jgi:hypothetical protein
MKQSNPAREALTRAVNRAIAAGAPVFVNQPATHNKDADCTVDAETGLCTVCGVLHGEPCDECGGCGFHGDACSLNEANWIDAQETRENLVDLGQFQVKAGPAVDADELSQVITDALAESSPDFGTFLAVDEGQARQMVESIIRYYCRRRGVEVK